MLLASFLVWPSAIQSIILISFIIFSIYSYFSDKNNAWCDKKKMYPLLIIISFYLFHLLSFFWSKNLHNWTKIYQHNIIFPFFIFSIFHNDYKINFSQFKTILLFFNVSLVLFLIKFYIIFIKQISYCQSCILATKPIHLIGYPINTLPFLSQLKELLYLRYINTNRWEFPYSLFLTAQKLNYKEIFDHHTYISAIIVICIFINVYLFIHTKCLKFKSIFILINLFYLYFLLILDSSINKILVFIPLLYILYTLKWKKKVITLLGLSLLFSTILLYKIYPILISNIEFYQIIPDVDESKVILDFTRKHIYQYSLNIWLQSKNYLFGIGTSGFIEQLNEDLRKLNYPEIFNKTITYNTHCDYLKFLVSGGLINLFLYLTCIFYLIYLSYKNNTFLFFSIFILVFSNSLIENYFDRIWGVYIYCFFILLNKKFNEMKI